MSLVINSSLEYLQTRLRIPAERMMLYGDKTIEEILHAEALQGNQEAIKLATDMFTDPKQLIELFQLADPQNKLVIIQAMDSYQREKILPMLEVKDLVQGLQFFTQESLLDMLEEIPKEELVKVVFQLFTEEQVIQYMPQEQLDKFLTSTEMDKEVVLKNMQSLPQIYVQQMIESVTGEAEEGDIFSLVSKLGQFGDLQYKTALKNLDPTQKQVLTLLIANNDKKMYEKFDAEAYTYFMGREREKDELINSMDVIKPEHLQNMIKKLPDDLMSIVLTQIDTDKFAETLINKFPEILAQFVAG